MPSNLASISWFRVVLDLLKELLLIDSLRNTASPSTNLDCLSVVSHPRLFRLSFMRILRYRILKVYALEVDEVKEVVNLAREMRMKGAFLFIPFCPSPAAGV